MIRPVSELLDIFVLDAVRCLWPVPFSFSCATSVWVELMKVVTGDLSDLSVERHVCFNEQLGDVQLDCLPCGPCW